jgi:hypothetical protein
MRRSARHWQRAVGGGLKGPGISPAGLAREQQFARHREALGRPVIRPTRRFMFITSYYVPDWYSPDDQTYFEVLGSRQRAHHWAQKFDLMVAFYPEVKLEPVYPDGRPYRVNQGVTYRWRAPFAAELGVALSRETLSLRELSRCLGWSHSSVGRVLTQPHGYSDVCDDVYAWLTAHADGAPIPTCPHTAAPTMDTETRRLGTEIGAKVRDLGLCRAAIARGVGVTPQNITNVLNGWATSRPLLDRIAAWLEGPGANGAGLEDRRKTQWKTPAGSTT